ncbi:uncharacterized protein LOC115672632 isoform X1 [Syzygium oleosum]|uniref:uncharacterized protein LOC115672632 isoform X1 n=2 Tax=Syzygium oleosum TaxID=219896 RepID=UPI0024B99B5C|nr:uncharacterized protein LOC115672632 isoform X1 [Syzygium oleosum]
MEKLRGLGHLFATVFLYGVACFMVVPAITDVTMSALCPGVDECSLAIYLSGIQQAIIGFGTVILTPLIGNLSDEYGRKALLTIPMTAYIIPLVIMAYSRETKFFYAYFVLRTLAAMVGEGTISCLALAYVADNVPGTERVSAFGILSGVFSAAFVFGTLAARFISTALTFQVAAVVSMVAVVYMRIFLKDSIPVADESTRPILKGSETDNDQNDSDSMKKIHIFKKIPSIGDLICLLRSSKIFAQAAVVAFFNNLAEGGLQASLLYYLKARFHFNKTQFADLMLIVGVAGTLSQLLFMPLLAPVLGEERLLSIGLFVGFSNMFLYSISWAAWVPYATTVFTLFVVFVSPCIRSIASKQVGPLEQGKAQGCLSGITSFANIVSPLIFSPLTALFLSEAAPFPYPGFSLMCIGLAQMIAFVQSLMMRAVPPSTIREVFSEDA